MANHDMFEDMVVVVFSLAIISTTDTTLVEKFIDGVRILIMFHSCKYIWNFLHDEH